MLATISLANSPYREIYIPIIFISLAIGLQIALLMYYRSILNRKSAKISSQLSIALGTFILGYSLSLLFLTIQNFFLSLTSSISTYFYVQGWFFIGLGNFGFCLIIEALYRKSFHSKFVFSILAIISLFVNGFAGNNLAFNIIGFGLFLIVNGFFIYFLSFLIKRAIGTNRKLLIINIIGFICYLSGFISSIKAVFNILNSEILLLVTYPLLMIGMVVIFYSLYQMPLFTDVDWREKIEELYIISQVSKETLYYYNFKDPTRSIQNSNKLFSGGILGLQSILALLSESTDEVNSIELAESRFLLDSSKTVVCVLSVQNYFRIHEWILRQIKDKFEETYGYLLQAQEFVSFDQSLFNGFQNFIEKILY